MKSTRRARILCIPLAIAFLASCSTDITFDLPQVDPILSVNSIVDPDDDFKLIVTMARPVLEENIQMDINCQVNIYENGDYFAQLKLDSSDYRPGKIPRLLKFSPDTKLNFSEGEEYKIEINYPGFEPLIAKTIKPNAVKINNISTRHFTGEMPDWYYKTPGRSLPDISGKGKIDTSLVEFTITFDDPYESMNFYRIGVKCLYKGDSRSPYFDHKIQYASYTFPDPCFMKVIFESDYSSYMNNHLFYEILYNDTNTNGKEQSIKILVPDSEVGECKKCVIYLYTLSEDYYKYMLDMWKYSKTKDDPFAEPMKFFSNSNNGCGIFAFSSIDTDTVQF